MFDTNNPTFIILFAVSISVILVVGAVFFIILSKKNSYKKAKEEEPAIDNNKWVNALGGKDNIVSLEAKGSRLIVNLKDKSLLNKDELHELGVLSIINSQDKATLVVKDKAEDICNLLK